MRLLATYRGEASSVDEKLKAKDLVLYIGTIKTIPIFFYNMRDGRNNVRKSIRINFETLFELIKVTSAVPQPNITAGIRD